MSSLSDPHDQDDSSRPVVTSSLLLMLSALTALTPIAIDICLPAIPSVAEAYGVVIHDAELTISYYLLGFSFGQFMGGPLSDRFGRRRMVLIGLGMFVVGSLGTVLATSMMELWCARVIQAIGGGLAVVNTASAIRDLSRGKEGAVHMIRVVQVMLIAPLIAPVIGMLIYQSLGWESVFWFLLLYSAALWLLFARYFSETSQQRTRWMPFSNYLIVLKEKRSWGFLATTGASYAGLLGFVAASPGILMGYFGLSSVLYPLVFAASVSVMLLVNRYGMRQVRHFGPVRVIWFGQGVQMISTSLMLLYIGWADDHSLWVYLPLIITALCCHSLITANCTASTTEFFPTRSGTATALIGSIGFAIGGLSGSIIGGQADTTPFTTAWVMWAFCLGGILIRWISGLGGKTGGKETHGAS